MGYPPINVTPIKAKERRIANKKGSLNKLDNSKEFEIINYFKAGKNLKNLSKFEDIEEIHGLIVSMYQKNKTLENREKNYKEFDNYLNDLIIINENIEL